VATELINLLVNYINKRSPKEVASRYAHGKLIDIGCGTKPRETLLFPYVQNVQKHFEVDHKSTIYNKTKIHVFCSAYSTQVQDNSFDTAVCTAVLEHLEESGCALAECLRALKSQGVAIFSCPLIWHLHEELLYLCRFRKYGIVYLFEKAGFEILELRALSGFWVMFGRLSVNNLCRVHRGSIKYVPIIPSINLVIQGISYLLDKLDKAEQWVWIDTVVANKCQQIDNCDVVT